MAPVNTVKTQPLEPILQELVKMGAQPQGPLFIAVRDVLTATQKTLTIAGQIQPQAPIGTAAVGVGTQTQNLTDTGNLNSLGNVDDTSTDHLTDGTGSPLAGGTLARIALDNNARLANSFRGTPVNATNIPVASTTLSNDGISHLIGIAASSQQFAPGTVAYNSSSFDPGSFGTWIVGYLDPTFSGGAVTPVFGVLPTFQASAEGFIPLGKIVSVGGSANTGGGNTGGTTPGGGGGRGVIQS